MKIAKNTSGISLIEIMISITVLSVGILGLLQAFPRGTAVQRTLELESIATNLAQAKVESFSTIAYDDITVGTQESSVRVDPDSSSPFYDFTRTTIVDFLDENLATTQTDVGLKKITVRIVWTRPLSASSATTTLVTMLNKR